MVTQKDFPFNFSHALKMWFFQIDLQTYFYSVPYDV